MSPRALAAFAVLCQGIALFAVAPAAAQLVWDVSVKFVDDTPLVAPNNCQGRVGGLTEADVVSQIDYANEVLDRLDRGYRFRLKPQGTALTSTVQPNVPPPPIAVAWELMPIDGDGLAAMSAAVVQNYCIDGPQAGQACTSSAQCSGFSCVNQFAYDPDALNVYVISDCAGGFSSTRNVGANLPIVIMGQFVQGGQTRIFHEAGHALGICHTHGCPGAVDGARDVACETFKASWCTADADDDVSGDTACDCSDWDDENDIASNAFSSPYQSLSTSQQEQVLDTLFNVMAYHMDNEADFPNDTIDCTVDGLDSIGPGCTIDENSSPASYDVMCPDPDAPGTMISIGVRCRHRLTDDQLDRAADRSNCLYPSLVSGRTWFVGSNPGTNAIECPDAPVSSGLVEAHGRAADGDVIMLWPGTYSDQLDFTRPMTLRASRGTATIQP